MKRWWSALGGTGHWSSVRSRRLVRGCPALGRACREAPNACATCGSRAVPSAAVHPVIARPLPAPWVTSAALGIGTSDTRGVGVRHATLDILIKSIEALSQLPDTLWRN
jgi:hypothetical protein